MENRLNVVHEATDRLCQSSHLFLRYVRCDAKEGTVCIQGKVPSYYLKQTAQNLVQSIEGVKLVDNRLEVVSACGVSSEADSR